MCRSWLPTPNELDVLSVDAAIHVLCRRFGWLRPRRDLLAEWLVWQGMVSPRPDFYYRWHLPRLVNTLELLGRALDAAPGGRVIDLGAFAPYAILMEQRYREHPCKPFWTRTSFDGAPEVFHASDGQVYGLESIAVDFTTPALPFESGSFDMVLLTGVLEHLNRHSQNFLAEINRILVSGGLLLLTTPNVTSWKKLILLSEGEWQFDSPTFGGRWGHRYEYSHYQLREVLGKSGFQAVAETTRDVYFNDPTGVGQLVQFAAVLTGKMLAGRFRSAAKLLARGGSGLFFLHRKVADAPPESERAYMPI